jgi:DNA-binding IclR family transcriptional regulator
VVNWQNNPKIRDNQHKNGRDSYTNTSLLRATNILYCLSNGINTNTEIARHCQYSTSTVHRLLNVMKNLNWIVQDRINHQYYLGPVVNHLLSNQADAHRYLLINALQEMVRLSQFSRETINLSVLVQLRTVLLHFIPSEQELKIVEVDSGHGMQFAVGATAKVLLSQLSEKEIKEVLNKVDLFELTGKSIEDRNLLLAQLMDIKRRGYGISYGERIVGAMCISTAVKNYSHPVALSILGPESRIKPRAGEIMEELLASADRISKSIINTL